LLIIKEKAISVYNNQTPPKETFSFVPSLSIIKLFKPTKGGLIHQSETCECQFGLGGLFESYNAFPLVDPHFQVLHAWVVLEQLVKQELVVACRQVSNLNHRGGHDLQVLSLALDLSFLKVQLFSLL
jgi:hypothetical protein